MRREEGESPLDRWGGPVLRRIGELSLQGKNAWGCHENEDRIHESFRRSAMGCDSDLPAHREQQAGRAFGPDAGADGLAEGDEPLVDLDPVAFGELGGE